MGLVHWQENGDPVPAKIFMFLDFQNVTILRPEVGIGKGIYAVVQSAVSSSSQSRTEPHTLVGKLSHRLVMEDDLCLVDVDSLVMPVPVVEDNFFSLPNKS